MSDQYLLQLFSDNAQVEVRHLHDGRAESGIFDSVESLQYAIHRRKEIGNLYTTLNRPSYRKIFNRFGESAMKDRDFTRITRLVFDFDPVRSPGTASTADELKAARQVSVKFMQARNADGWHAPLVAMSGNGWHLQYRTVLPADADTRQMLRQLYRGLGREWTTEQVSFDTTVRNAGRIFRLYGTLNRKGPDTPERPHREAYASVPPAWRQVSRVQVENLAKRYASKPAPQRSGPVVAVVGRGDYRSLDVVALFRGREMYMHHLERNIHEVVCPWEHQHSSSSPADTVIFEADGGWPGFHCKHDHCADRGIMAVIRIMPEVGAYCGKAWRRT